MRQYLNEAHDKVINGLLRRIFEDSVQWIPDGLWGNDEVAEWDYAVYKFPFVPGFHVCYMDDTDSDLDDTQEFILSSHKTLHEAMGVCKVLLANGGIKYV